MTPEPNRPAESGQRPLQSAPTGELISHFFRQASELVKKELELARTEITESVKAAITITLGMLMAGVFAFVALAAIAASLVLGLSNSMEPWAAALAVGVLFFAIAGTIALVVRSKGQQKPLERTQKTLKEDVQWAREKVA